MKKFNAIDNRLDGLNLIEASAGTGKTYTITTLYVRLLVERNLSVDQILVVTFTEAATAELRSRIRARLIEILQALITKNNDDDLAQKYLLDSKATARRAEQRISRALSHFDEAAIHTIHGFCKRMLEENAFESGVLFDVELIKDQTPLLVDIVHDFWAKEIYGASPIFVRYLRSKGINPKQLVQFTKTVLSGLDTEIIPAKVEAPEAEREFQTAFMRARDIWQKGQSEITNLLATQTTLKKNMFNPKKIGSWLDDIDQYLANAAQAYPIRLADKPSKKRHDHSIANLATSKIEKGTRKKFEPPRHPFFDACEDISNTWDLFEKCLLDFKLRLLEYAAYELKHRKKKNGVWAFDDLLLELDDALQNSSDGERLVETMSARFRAAMIDEFQDTDQVQYRIFRRVYKGVSEPLFLIGDPKQSIYAFRSADIFTYLEAARDAQDLRRTLDVNWRSDPALINAVNTLFSRSKHPFVLSGIDFIPAEPRQGASNDLRDRQGLAATPLQIRFVKRIKERHGKTNSLIQKKWTDNHLPAMVATDIAELILSDMTIQGRPIEPEDIAILTRTNKQSRVLQTALGALGIKAVLWSADSVFDSEEAAELIRLLAAIKEPDNSGKIRAALSTDLLGLSGNEIYLTIEEDEIWDRWIEAFRSWRDQWQTRGFIQMMRSVLNFAENKNSRPIGARLVSLKDGERRITNLRQLVEILHKVSVKNHLGMGGLLRWFQAQCRCLQAQQALEASDTDAAQLRVESDEGAIRLITIHKAKGLEFPIVYCPYLWDGYMHNARRQEVVFHDPKKAHKRTIDIGSEKIEEHRGLADKEQVAENLRLLYVALTRAKHLCVVVWGAMTGMQSSPLGYLLHHTQNDITLNTLRNRLKTMTDDEMLGELSEIVAAAGQNTIGVSELCEPMESEPQIRCKDTTSRLSCQRPSRKVPSPLSTTSFSALTSSVDSLSRTEIEGRDRDEWIHHWDSSNEAGRDQVKSPREIEDILLADFDKGPRAGNCLHTIYENLDFANSNRSGLETLTAQVLAAFGFDVKAWKETVCRAIAETLDTPLDPANPDLKLGTVQKDQRLNELEFIFPVSRHVDSRRAITTDKRISTVIAEHGKESVPTAYIERLLRFDFSLHPGFLKGFIDLVFHKNSRYYLVDYKSNHLGTHPRDYTRDRLERSMIEHDYFLQYLVYSVALHRFLEYRLVDYDYDTHFGSVYYLFLRGMSPRFDSGCGVYKTRPPRELVVELSALFKDMSSSRGTP
ncbi:MAG: exodeoxyribonuclease V subunit beta [Proteobacteria bacterium]|nr:exodeoxyribonuclease V subunit beta [Pseudomonadota bacterium]